MMNHSEKLKLIMQISGVTQEKLADELEVSFATVNSWINERSKPHKRNLEKIDALYRACTGQKTIPQHELDAKKRFVEKQAKTAGNVLKNIITTPDIYDTFALTLTYNSNSIEGNTLTEPETAAVIFDNANIANKDLVELMEAKNHRTAFDFMISFLEKTGNINEAFVCTLHEKVLNGIRPDAGRYRTVPVRIAGANVPTANPASVAKRMSNLITRAEQPSNGDVIRHVAEVHAEFEQIHPFSDGNGRVGRLLLDAMLLLENLPPAIIEQNKRHIYYQALNDAQVRNDMSGLENFIADAVIQGIGILHGNDTYVSGKK